MVLIIVPNSRGILYPTVSGILTVDAPASITASITSQRKWTSVLVASIGENSTSSTKLLASLTISTDLFKASSLLMRN